MGIRNYEQLTETVHDVVRRQKITDVHTHLYSPNFGDLLLWNIDELLTYHYLVAEVMRWSDMSLDQFWSLSKQEQADLIWSKLFIEHTPVSEACRGVLTCLHELGLDPSTRSLAEYREFFKGMTSEEHVERVFDLAQIEHAVMTNDPFDERERKLWLNGIKPTSRFHAALRIDPLLNHYGETMLRLQEWGYSVEKEWTEQSIGEIKRFLQDWIQIMDPLYMAVSLPPTFTFPEDSDRGRIIKDCILPVTEEAGIPFAMMIGVKKAVNPALGDAGDYLGKAKMGGLEYLLKHYPRNKFLITMLSRENQHELTVLARKFNNLMIFGCWWFMNNPVIINEMTRMRMEMLGTSFIPQHSDARVLDQLIYKWKHSKQIICEVLIDKYHDLIQAGWILSREEIERDVEGLLHQNFWNFIGKKVPSNVL